MTTLMEGLQNYAGLYNPFKSTKPKGKKTEGFTNMESPVTSVFYLIIVSFALFLAYKKNGNAFDPLGFLAAFCCPVLYIIYVGFTTGFKGYFN
jgi:hypothetical protein